MAEQRSTRDSLFGCQYNGSAMTPCRCGMIRARSCFSRSIGFVESLLRMTLFLRVAPNTRLKLAAPFIYCRIAFVNVLARRRSLGAIR
jgi:hypothetical protein